MRLILALPLLLAATAPAPSPGALKTFGDWATGCDNTRRCTLASLAPETAPGPGYTIGIIRAAGPDGGYEIKIGNTGDGAAPTMLRIGTQRFALHGNALAGANAQRIVAAMAGARSLSLLGRTGRPLGTVSLTGASAALRYVDAVQQRVGTVTAVIARGNAPAASVPAAPASPTISAPAITGTPARLSRSQIAAMKRTARCEAPPSPDLDWSPVVSAVGGGVSLAILPCSAGAYNVIGAVFVVCGNRIEPARTDAPAGFEATGADPGTPVPSVINGGVENGIVFSYAKGRGLGDCGLAQRFVWDGSRLRLIEQSEMSECRGNPDFIRSWTARVERR